MNILQGIVHALDMILTSKLVVLKKQAKPLRFPVTFRSKQLKGSDYHRVSEATSLRMTQSWPRGSQTAVKKCGIVNKKYYINFLK